MPGRTEKDKMLAGELYHALDPQLTRERTRCRDLCRRFNASGPEDLAERRALLAELFGRPTEAWIEPPFYCDYGANIELGPSVFLNFNCMVLDVMPVRIGSHSLLGPAVQIYTATHPWDAAERHRGLEYGKPVTISSDVWIGGGAIVCPGVTVGDRAVIGAGSVVTRSVPADVFAAGNPARVVKHL